jgi:MFS family permease
VPGPPEATGSILGHGDFRRLLTAQFLSQAADGLAQAIFAFVLVLEPLSRGTPGRILSLFALTLLPYSFLSPFLGVFVDRWSRRALLVGTNLVRAAVLIALPLWAQLLSGHLPLYFSVLLLLGLGRLFLTTKGAVLPVVLHEQHLLKGNSLSGGGGMIAALAGGVLGVELLRVVTPHEGLTIAGFVYAGASLVALRLSAPFEHRAARARSFGQALSSVVEGLWAGLRAVVRRPRARLPLMAIFLLRTLTMVVAIAAILIIKKEFPSAGDRFGRLDSGALALGSAGVGAFTAALVAPYVEGRMKRPGMIVSGFLIAGLGIIALGGIINIPAVLGLTFVAGFGTFLTKVAVDAQVQDALPDELRGRAFALYDILYNGASVLAGALMVGLQNESFRAVLIGFGVLSLLCAAAMAGAMRRAEMELT